MFRSIGFLLAVIAWPAQAEWLLDYESSRISFVAMTDKAHLEISRFLIMKGGVDDAGQVHVEIEADSVSTGVPQRDEQIRKTLFETDRFPETRIVTQVQMEPILALANGVQMEVRQPIQVALRNIVKEYEADLLVTRLDDNRFQVVTLTPLILNLTDFGLTDQVEMLRNLAKLEQVGFSAPVTAVFIFTHP